MKTPTERSIDRDSRNKESGLKKASTSGWVLADEHEAAKAAMRQAIAPFIERAKKLASQNSR